MEESHKCWRKILALCHVLVFVGSMMASLSLGWGCSNFKSRCILFTNMHACNAGNNTHKVPSFYVRMTDFGSDTECYYAIFTNVSLIIYTLIWFWTNLLLPKEWEEKMKKAGDDSAPDARLLLPTLVFTLVGSCCVFVASCVASAGANYFRFTVNRTIEDKCAKGLGQFEIATFDKNLAYRYLQLTEWGTWSSTCILILAMTIAGLRFKENFKSTMMKKAQPRNQQPTTPLLPIQEVDDENFYSSDEDADITIMDPYKPCNTDDEIDNTTVQLITKGKGEHPQSSSHIA